MSGVRYCIGHMMGGNYHVWTTLQEWRVPFEIPFALIERFTHEIDCDAYREALEKQYQIKTERMTACGNNYGSLRIFTASGVLLNCDQKAGAQ